MVVAAGPGDESAVYRRMASSTVMSSGGGDAIRSGFVVRGEDSVDGERADRYIRVVEAVFTIGDKEGTDTVSIVRGSAERERARQSPFGMLIGMLRALTASVSVIRRRQRKLRLAADGGKDAVAPCSFNISADSNLAPSAPTALRFGPASLAPTEQPTDVYFATVDRVPTQLRRDFITDTYITFVKYTRQVKDLRDRDVALLLGEDALTMYSNIADDYLVALSAHIEALEKRSPPSLRDIGHYQSLYSCLHLMQTVYLPASGSRRGLVGEELLDWLNRNFIAPSTEEGVALAALDAPWADAAFWPYIARCVLRGLGRSAVHFLAKLDSHPSPYLQHIANTLRQWKERVAVLRREFDALPPREGGEWRAGLADVLGILEGNAEVVVRCCRESEEGWREAVCVWGVWVRVGLRRDDLPELVKDVLEHLPADAPSEEDLLHLALLEGSTGKIIDHANKLDIWLAAHLTDMLAPIDLLDDVTDMETTVAVRDYLVLAYAEYLRSDPHLWRLTVDYMYTCGPSGELMADQILLTVPIRLAAGSNSLANPDATNRTDSADVEMRDAAAATSANANDAIVDGVEALSRVAVLLLEVEVEAVSWKRGGEEGDSTSPIRVPATDKVLGKA
ncbi:hypothetical protein AURDEDRAFT_160791 [Auricularia subglabra TFB-10046 SS5]|nr:hypothetical protein AURDEDRAFT_160791 [Auricularia subglabra TFB-10046 SS5]